MLILFEVWVQFFFCPVNYRIAEQSSWLAAFDETARAELPSTLSFSILKSGPTTQFSGQKKKIQTFLFVPWLFANQGSLAT